VTARLLLALVMTGAIAVAARAAPPVVVEGGPIPEDGYFEVIQKVAPRVWLIRQEKPFHLQPIGNVTVIEQADGLVMVDSGGTPASGRRILALIRSVSAKPVKAVIISQWHGDKPLGLAAILQAWPKARVISTEATRRHLADPATMNTPGAPDPAANKAMVERYRGFADYGRQMAGRASTDSEQAGWRAMARLFTQYAHDMDGALTLQPKEGFTDRLTLADQDSPVQALFLGRADTDGDAVVWLPRQRVLVAGETVVAPIPFGYLAYPKDWLEVLAQLKAYPFKVLIPGHGEPQTDRAYIERLIALIETVRAQVGPLAAQGLELKEVRARVDLSRQAHAFVGEDPWRLRWFDQYWTDPIVASAYKEARGEPIIQKLG
jgi:glyoxylase-like metal-dependent hydrolase (beta-lactamase superfamily II)